MSKWFSKFSVSTLRCSKERKGEQGRQTYKLLGCCERREVRLTLLEEYLSHSIESGLFSPSPIACCRIGQQAHVVVLVLWQKVWGLPDLNRRPLGLESRALPCCAKAPLTIIREKYNIYSFGNIFVCVGMRLMRYHQATHDTCHHTTKFRHIIITVWNVKRRIANLSPCQKFGGVIICHMPPYNPTQALEGLW